MSAFFRRRKRSNHDVAFDNRHNTVTRLNQNTQHTTCHKRRINRNTYVKARKYHSSEIENAMANDNDHIYDTEGIPRDETVFSLSDDAALGVNKMTICTDGNINAGVTVTIDEHHSTYVDDLNNGTSVDDLNNGTYVDDLNNGTYVDDLKRKQLHVKDVTTTNSDETIRKRIRIEDDINSRKDNISATKLQTVLKQKRRYPILQEEIKGEIFHTELENTNEQNEQHIVGKQPLYNPDQVVQQVFSNHALSRPLQVFSGLGI